MAYLMHEGKLVCEMWPAELPRLGGVQQAAATLSPLLKVPESRADFFAWARCTKNPDPVDSTRGWIVAVTGLSNRQTRCELTVSIQGFATQRQLAMELTGNWDAKKETARTARQVLVIGPGNFPQPFEAQVTALRKAVNNIAQQLKAKNFTKLSKKGLELERVVFTKARKGRKPIPDLPDPFGDIAAIQDEWIITNRLDIEVQQDNHTVRQGDHFDVEPGDFVQAEVRFDIQVITTRNREKQVRVKLSMTHLVKLCDAKQVPRQQQTTVGVGLTTLRARDVVSKQA